MTIKILIALVLAHLLLMGVMLRKSSAEETSGAPEINSILPGEMNPTNKKEEDDLGTKSRSDKACPGKQQRYPIMECVKEGTPPTIDKNCDQMEPILKCGKKPFKIHCTHGKIARERSRCIHIKRVEE